jgi:hypothetical protein
LKNEFTVNESYAIPQIWDTTKKGKKSFNFSAKVFNEHLPDPSTFPLDEPIALSYPRSINYTVRIGMPETWTWSSAELHIKNDSYQFDFTPVVNDRHITLQYYFKTFKDHIPAAAVQQYKTDYKAIAERVYFELYKNSTSVDEPADNPSPSPGSPFLPRDKPSSATGKLVNWPAVWLTFFFAVFFTWLWKRLNARSEDTLYTHESGYRLGGWTTVLGITIFLSLILQVYRFINNYLHSYLIYGYKSWETMGRWGGRNIQYLSLVELFISLVSIASCGSVLYWFLKRRDIFPRMFTWYVGILLSGSLTLIILYNIVPYQVVLDNFKQGLLTQFIRTCVYGAVWVTYINRSERVKGTFLQPFNQ